MRSLDGPAWIINLPNQAQDQCNQMRLRVGLVGHRRHPTVPTRRAGSHTGHISQDIRYNSSKVIKVIIIKNDKGCMGYSPTGVTTTVGAASKCVSFPYSQRGGASDTCGYLPSIFNFSFWLGLASALKSDFFATCCATKHNQQENKIYVGNGTIRINSPSCKRMREEKTLYIDLIEIQSYYKLKAYSLVQEY